MAPDQQVFAGRTLENPCGREGKTVEEIQGEKAREGTTEIEVVEVEDSGPAGKDEGGEAAGSGGRGEPPQQKGEKGSKNAKNKNKWNTVTFMDCDWIWEYCKDMNEYRTLRLDQKRSAQVKGAQTNGAEDWNLVTANFKKMGRRRVP